MIIPAYNAADTLPATLNSAIRQTVRDCEIIVVDDGSLDRTGAIAEDYAARDARIRVVRTPNGGVARARNAGIEHARGDFIAPLDADDLWHPRKLEFQLERFRERPEAGLVYNWFRRIGEDGRVLGDAPLPVVEGRVIHRHLWMNFISNGSTPLIRRRALDELRYSPRLREAGAQGCEDYLLQLELALRAPFACAPAFLTGYRRTAGAMSGDASSMIRSHIQVFETVADRLPRTARPVLRARLAGFHMELARNRGRRGALGEAATAIARAAALDPAAAARSPLRQLAVRRSLRAEVKEAGAPFLDWPPDRPNGDWTPDRGPAARRCAALDQGSEDQAREA